MRHAYLILAHNEPALLQELISALDDCRNDIFVHWDAKAGELPVLNASNAGLRFTSKRIDVRWADFSMVEAEYVLFADALASGPYAYYHLLSGVDYPVASQDKIHAESERLQGTEFIGYAVPKPGELDWRTQHKFIYPKDFRKPKLWKKALRSGFCKFQDMVKYRRHNQIMKKGPQWFSCTQDFMEYLIEKQPEVFKLFPRTFTPDEIFVQTLCWNSPFKDKVADLDDEFGSCRRYIKWIDGRLEPITADDIDSMTDGGWWFARKFSSASLSVCMDIKKRING